jgi:hypothetical protein
MNRKIIAINKQESPYLSEAKHLPKGSVVRVAGAGFAGLSFAYHLKSARPDIEVTIYDVKSTEDLNKPGKCASSCAGRISSGAARNMGKIIPIQQIVDREVSPLIARGKGMIIINDAGNHSSEVDLTLEEGDEDLYLLKSSRPPGKLTGLEADEGINLMILLRKKVEDLGIKIKKKKVVHVAFPKELNEPAEVHVLDLVKKGSDPQTLEADFVFLANGIKKTDKNAKEDISLSEYYTNSKGKRMERVVTPEIKITEQPMEVREIAVRADIVEKIPFDRMIAVGGYKGFTRMMMTPKKKSTFLKLNQSQVDDLIYSNANKDRIEVKLGEKWVHMSSRISKAYFKHNDGDRVKVRVTKHWVTMAGLSDNASIFSRLVQKENSEKRSNMADWIWGKVNDSPTPTTEPDVEKRGRQLFSKLTNETIVEILQKNKYGQIINAYAKDIAADGRIRFDCTCSPNDRGSHPKKEAYNRVGLGGDRNGQNKAKKDGINGALVSGEDWAAAIQNVGFDGVDLIKEMRPKTAHYRTDSFFGGMVISMDNVLTQMPVARRFYSWMLKSSPSMIRFTRDVLAGSGIENSYVNAFKRLMQSTYGGLTIPGEVGISAMYQLSDWGEGSMASGEKYVRDLGTTIRAVTQYYLNELKENDSFIQDRKIKHHS